MSGLRCKVGDLALIKCTDNSTLKHFVGEIHRIARPSAFWPDSWLFEPPLVDDGRPVSFHDKHLLPIRDPGDDAVDETLLWSTPGDRASRNIERCEKLVAEIEGQS